MQNYRSIVKGVQLLASDLSLPHLPASRTQFPFRLTFAPRVHLFGFQRRIAALP